MKKIMLLLLLSPYCFAESTDLLIKKGQLALQQKNKTAALQYLTHAVQQEQYNLTALFHLGAVHYYAQEYDQAIPLFKQCYEQQHDNVQYIYSYAMAANHGGEFNLARDIIEQHYSAEPSQSDLRTKLLPIYLRNMDWYYASKLCRINDLWWYNENIQNKTVLLDLSSQWNGRGDVMQLMRYALHLHNAGAQVIAYVRAELMPLLSLCPYVIQVVPATQSKPLCDKEYSLTMDRLTLRMSDTLYEPSKDIPYLYADPTLCTQWRNMLAPDPQFKVGFCFQSSNMRDYFSNAIIPGPRGMHAQELTPLFSITNISFYSLQTGEDAQVQSLCNQYANVHAFNDLDASAAFMDTAALMKQLDLVITVDTSIAHLAGALGVQTWLMLPYAGDFRWFTDRSDSPWYPTIKLFRQTQQGEWQNVIVQIKAKLAQIVSSNPS